MRFARDILKWTVSQIAWPWWYVALRADDPPPHVSGKQVYLIGVREQPWVAMFNCPCGCGDLVQLSLMEDDRPRWTVTVSEIGLVTLRPSIHRTRGCKSHFFVRAGQIEWAHGR